LTDAESATVYECLQDYMQAAYGVAANPAGGQFLSWTAFSLVPYVSDTHGGRHVMNYANPTAAPGYRAFEQVGTMPAGSVLAKNSFVVDASGKAALGPLFLMQKMSAGFNAESGDWRYTLIMPDGSTFGATGGQGGANVAFCNDCHAVVAEDQDYLYFLPDQYRINSAAN
jgi:hypothetical protein